MPINFPNSPTLNDVYRYGNRTWTWNGNFWQATATFTIQPNVITLTQLGALQITSGSVRWYAPWNTTLVSVKPRVRVAADSTITIQLYKNGLLVAVYYINSGQTEGVADVTNTIGLAAGDYLTVSLASVGSAAFPGYDLYLQIQYSRD